MIDVGIVGGTGYTGVELMRILALHPEVNIKVVTSRSDAGKKISDLYPNFFGVIDTVFTEPALENLSSCGVVFFATPHGTAMEMASELLDLGIRVIDLSADFRIKDADLWAKWYGQKHTSPDALSQAVYGLPEVNREQLKSARLIACAGCYPTAVQLGFIPLIEKGVIDLHNLVADVKSGTSGAGRNAKTSLIMSETGESFKAYAVSGHRHHPEIVQGLQSVAKGAVGLTFVPHLLPMIRGIHATLFCQSELSIEALRKIYSERYQHEPFVSLLPENALPDTRNVKGGNHCQIAVLKPEDGEHVVILAVIDNLVKGAAGQAVQCMNISLGLDERQGLNAVALYP